MDVDLKDNDGRTLLSYAAEEGNEAIVKLLFEQGNVNVDSKGDDGRTPLSAQCRHEAAVSLLLAQ